MHRSRISCRPMFGTTQRRSVTTTGRFRSGRLRNLVGIDLEEKTLQPQARVAAEDWVDELEFVDILPEPAGRDWRSVTIAAAARLTKRLNVDADRRTPRDTPADTKVSPILSSNCPAAIRLA